MNDTAFNNELNDYLDHRYSKAAEQAQEMREARRNEKVEDRTAKIMADRDYCEDLILNMIDSEHGDVFWDLLRATESNHAEVISRFKAAYVEEAKKVAESEVE